MSNEKQHYYSNPVHATDDRFKNHPYNTCYDPFGNTVATEGNAIWQILSPINYEAYEANPESREAAEDLVNDINKAIVYLKELKYNVKIFTRQLNVSDFLEE